MVEWKRFEFIKKIHLLLSLYSKIVLTTTYSVKYKSLYSKPVFNGTCMPSSVCLGATLTDICKNKQHICCVIDPELTTEYSYGENKFINLNQYFKFVKNTDRNKRFYCLLKNQSMKHP